MDEVLLMPRTHPLWNADEAVADDILKTREATFNGFLLFTRISFLENSIVNIVDYWRLMGHERGEKGATYDFVICVRRIGSPTRTLTAALSIFLAMKRPKVHQVKILQVANVTTGP